MAEKDCAHCGRTFTPKRSAQTYCSPACGYAAKRKPATWPPPLRDCVECGGEYGPKSANQKFCSSVCKERAKFKATKADGRYELAKARARANYQPRPARPVRLCDVEGCERKHLAKGLCQLHWRRSRYATERKNPEVVLQSMASLHGAYFPKQKPVVCRVAIGLMVICPACSSWMGALTPSDRYCPTCGTTLRLNAEEVSWVISERASTEVSRRTAN